MIKLIVHMVKELMLIRKHRNPIHKNGSMLEKLIWCYKELWYLNRRYDMAVEGFDICRELEWSAGCFHYKDQYKTINQMIFDVNQIKQQLYDLT